MNDRSFNTPQRLSCGYCRHWFTFWDYWYCSGKVWRRWLL